MKPARGFFASLSQRDLGLSRGLAGIYSDGEWISGCKCLRKDLRLRILKRLKIVVSKHGLEFSICREGLLGLNTSICGGTAYCRELLDRSTA